MGPDRQFGSFGFCFGPNGRFSTHFGPYLMFWDLTELWPMWPICPDGTLHKRALFETSNKTRLYRPPAAPLTPIEMI